MKPRDLSKRCNPAIFKFESTANVKPLKGIIGQDRAVRSLAFGLDMENEGYNIYLSGIFGTGKTTLAKAMIEKKAREKKIPSDWCYVNNFKDAYAPRALEFPAGMGKKFKEDLDHSLDEMFKQISKTLEGKDYESQKNLILNELVEETNNMYLRLEEEARSYGFTISKSSQNGVNSIPLKDGEPLSQEEYMAMGEEERSKMMRNSTAVQEIINEAYRKYKDLEKSTKENIKKLENETAREVTEPHFSRLLKNYGEYERVGLHLEEIHEDIIEHLEDFTNSEEKSSQNIFRHMDERLLSKRYQVNLVIDNTEQKNAPVVFESNCTFANLFGQIEYESEFGILATDFTKIKAGAVHKANGGYLVLHVYDIIKNFYVWDKLKRVLKNKEIIIESLSKNLGLGSTETLQPQPIPVDIKVILIGEPVYYYLLYAQDEEFQKLFKIKVDFDTEMNRNNKNIKEYASFISSVCTSEGLRHFSPDAVARVVDYGSRMAGEKDKLTTLFNKLVEIIYEANSWANYDKADLVKQEHVEKAIEEKNYRSSMIEDKIREQIQKNSLMINVTGKKVGEINGLAVYELGDYLFGKPVRITAKTFMGEKGLVNIEREIRMSGSIHSKGVLILSGYLGAQYAQDKPLSLSASLTMEQSYQGIEGDSASSTELYALISSLAEVPLIQGIAVTGSVNQSGEIQAVGGVNWKIEGFFQICKMKGLDGKQGVIIPHQNVKQLMLNDEVVAAVKNKEFNIWAIQSINEGIEILTGIVAGVKNDNGDFPEKTVHFLVNQKLNKWANKRKTELAMESENISSAVRIRRRRRR